MPFNDDIYPWTNHFLLDKYHGLRNKNLLLNFIGTLATRREKVADVLTSATGVAALGQIELVMWWVLSDLLGLSDAPTPLSEQRHSFSFA